MQFSGGYEMSMCPGAGGLTREKQDKARPWGQASKAGWLHEWLSNQAFKWGLLLANQAVLEDGCRKRVSWNWMEMDNRHLLFSAYLNHWFSTLLEFLMAQNELTSVCTCICSHKEFKLQKYLLGDLVNWIDQYHWCNWWITTKSEFVLFCFLSFF